MRRNMELIREILLAAERLPADGSFIDLPERDDGELRHHLRIVAQAVRPSTYCTNTCSARRASSWISAPPDACPRPARTAEPLAL